MSEYLCIYIYVCVSTAVWVSIDITLRRFTGAYVQSTGVETRIREYATCILISRCYHVRVCLYLGNSCHKGSSSN